METMRFKNPTAHPINLDPIGLGVVGPGDTIDVPLDLCAPGRASNGARSHSAIEQVAPQMVPVNEDERCVWAKVPKEPEPQSLVVSVQGRAPGVAPGIAALREAKAAAQAKAQEAAKKSKPEGKWSMAFTGAEKARIRALLGWGARYFNLSTPLEAAMKAIEDIPLPDDEAQIRAYLTQLDLIDTQIAEARGIAGVKQTGSIVLTDDQGLFLLRSEGARLVDAIAAILSVEVLKNFYRNGSPRGGEIRYG
jgi:hypothetical protein